MFKKSPNFKFIILIFLIAIISGFFWNFGNFGEPIVSDALYYDKAATNILEGYDICYGLGESCIEPQPLYPLFLSGVFYVFGHNLDAVRVAQIILFAFTSVLIFLLAKRLFGYQVGVYSGLLMGLFYPLAGYCSRLYREVFFTFLVVLFIYCLYQVYLSKKKVWFSFSGITLGLVMLTNAVTYFLPLLIIFLFLIVYKKKFFSKKMLICFFFFLFSLIIILSPWLIRNYYSDGGSADIKGGSALVNRAYLMEDIQEKYKEHFIGQSIGYFFAKKLDSRLDQRKLYAFRLEIIYEQIEDLSLFGYSQEEIGKIFQKEAISKIFKKPHLYFLDTFLYLMSFNNPMLPNPQTFYVYRMHNLFVNTHPEINEFIKGSIILIIRFIWLIFLFFVVYGGIKAIKKDVLKFSWLISVILYFNIVYSLLLAIPRYALPIWPFYIILFVYGLSMFLRSKNMGENNKKYFNDI